MQYFGIYIFFIAFYSARLFPTRWSRNLRLYEFNRILNFSGKRSIFTVTFRLHFFGRLSFLWQDLLFADNFVDEIFVRKISTSFFDNWNMTRPSPTSWVSSMLWTNTRNPASSNRSPAKRKSPPRKLVFFSVFYVEKDLIYVWNLVFFSLFFIEKDQKRPIRSHIS